VLVTRALCKPASSPRDLLMKGRNVLAYKFSNIFPEGFLLLCAVSVKHKPNADFLSVLNLLPYASLSLKHSENKLYVCLLRLKISIKINDLPAG
jgi:hypothetical protein